jgi:hypothetical protein
MSVVERRIDEAVLMNSSRLDLSDLGLETLPESQAMRVNAIMWRARLAWRSPPRESRCRLVLPLEAGIGARSSRSRPGPTAGRRPAGGPGSPAMDSRRGRARRAGRDHRHRRCAHEY